MQDTIHTNSTGNEMATEAYLQQLKATFEQLPHDIPLYLFTAKGHEDVFTNANRQVIRAFRELSSKITLREYDLDSGISPFATGDAIRSGWGPTNLALYGASHVGIFGGIIDTTNVEMILQLDALKTDYYHDEAYPTYLYFNPHDEYKDVEIDGEIRMKNLFSIILNIMNINIEANK